MYLDERSNALLSEVIKNPTVTSKKLQESYQLSRRQIDYSFKKINDWLEEQGKPAIQKINGQYRVEKNVFSLFDISQEENVDFYIPSEKERMYLITLYILTRDEVLSLNHFISELSVSKNTVLQDLKEVQKNLSSFNVELYYTRAEGYYTEGEEWNKRSAMLDAIQHVIRSYGGELFLQKFMDINSEKVEHIHDQIVQIEKELHLSFIDTELESLPYALEGIFKRIVHSKNITTEFFIDYNELSDTREYEAVKILIEDKDFISEDERLYLTLQLLTSNTVQKKHLKGEELPKLRLALRECLDDFERKAVIPIVDKESLLDKLFFHFKPAYYRIKYKLTTDYRPLEKISKEFEMLHYFVGESVEPLRKFLNSDIPENELMFITLFIGGHLIEQNEQTAADVKKRAVVVCPNGLSISKLMEKNLYTLFPEIHFHPAMSIREFKETDLEYELVFSATPVPVQSDKKLFVINQMMDEQEKKELRKRVMRSVYLFDEKQVDFNKVLEVIYTYTDVKNEEKLISSLKSLLNPAESVPVNEPVDGETIQLDQLLSENMIQRIDRVNNWQEALGIASKPLIQSEKITQEYVDEIKVQYPGVSEHIVLQGKIAIPHAETEKGVKKLGMSLLYIKDGIPNFDGSLLHFIVIIAAIDKGAHFTALIQLMELAGNQQRLTDLQDCKDESEMHQTIAGFIKEMK